MELESLQIQITSDAKTADAAIDSLVNRLTALKTALGGFKAISFGSITKSAISANSSLTTFSSTITNLSQNLKIVDNNISILNKQLSGVRIENSVSTSIDAITASMRKLGGKQISSAISNLPKLATGLQLFNKEINGIGALKFDTASLTSFVTSISRLGGKASTQAVTNLPRLTVELKNLMNELSKAPAVSENLVRMTEALSRLARTGRSSGTAATSLANSFGLFGNRVNFTRKSAFSIVTTFGKLYTAVWSLARVFGFLKESINISSSLTEVENVVRQTFGRYEKMINDFAETSIEKYGMSELSVKTFASRFQAMGMALDIPQKQMAKMSVRLTALTGDMASFYDVAQSDVAKSLQSIFTGTTKPMRQYSVDFTQATLNEWLMKKGIDANVKSMSQAQKAMVRYYYTLERMEMVTDDFQRTSTTWHNTLAVLHENFKELGKTVGTIAINAFKPFLRALNVVIQKVNSFVETVTSALGAIFGWRFEISKGGTSDLTDNLNDAYGYMDDLSDAAGSASGNTSGIAKNAKKAKKEIQQATRSFDELKTISKQNNNIGNSSGAGGSGSSGSGSVGQWVETPTKYMEFESSIKDLEGLGESIRDALINAMQGIKWDEVYAKASGFGTGLAKFLNGLFEGQKGTTLFGETGRLIANSLNTVLHGLDSFGTTFDWKQFGNSIADGVNKFFQNFDFALLAQTLNTWAQGAFDAVVTAIKGISWKDVWNGAKEFLSNLDVKTVAIIIGALTIKKILGLHLAKTALVAIGTAISKKIASAIAAKLGIEIAANSTIGIVLSDALSKKLEGLGTISGKIGKLALTIGSIVIAAEGGLALGKAIGNKIADATQPEEMKKYRVDFKFSDLFSYSLDDWKQGFTDWWNDTWGPAFSMWWDDVTSGDWHVSIPFTDIELPSWRDTFNDISKWWGNVKKYWGKKKDSALEIVAKIKNKASDLWKDFTKEWENVKNKVAEFKTKIASKASDLWEKFKASWGESKTAQFLLKIGSKAKDLWNKFKASWGETRTAQFLLKIASKISELWGNFKKSWGEKKSVPFLTKRATKISELWKDFKDSWGDNKAVTIGIGFVKNSLSNLWSSVTGFFGGKTVNVGTKATKKADGGVFSGGSWKPIKKYAVGGLPNMGQMFVAREAGPELVGTLGGHTAVMNNDQIVSSVSAGVAQAVKEVIQPLVKTSVGNNRPIQISLDGKVIFDSTRQSAREYFNRTGMSPYPV